MRGPSLLVREGFCAEKGPSVKKDAQQDGHSELFRQGETTAYVTYKRRGGEKTSK